MRRIPLALALALVAAPGGRALAAPASTGFDEANLDRSVSPCDDFYQYACGGWIQAHPIPADKSSYGAFHQLDDRNEALLHEILDQLVAGKGSHEDPYNDKLAAFYGSCLDTATVEKAAAPALAAEWKRLDAATTPQAMAPLLARLHAAGVSALFSLEQEPDPGNAKRTIGAVDQSGLGLPERDYYLATDEKSVTLRKQYVEHVLKSLQLGGEPAARAKADAEAVMRVETALAKASLGVVERRDPKKIYHLMKVAELEKLSPRFPWKAYFQEAGRPDLDELNVMVPDFFAALSSTLLATPPADLHAYLRWQVLRAHANWLNKAIDDEHFRFYGHVLNGTKEQQPRWKRCVQWTDLLMGEALARPFVRVAFPAGSKDEVQAMVKAIEEAMGADLARLQWMDEPTRAAAKQKLAKIYNMIGYPDHWRSYDKLTVDKRDLLGNVDRAWALEMARQLAKIGKPTDRTDWLMSPPTVNAYYEPLLNEMVFPAGILRPPFYDKASRPAVNHGAVGMVMGHELTHGFDDEGRQYDADGNLRTWWTPKVNEEFEKRAQCVVKQFDSYVAVDDLHVNGKLTLGENIADLGGMKLAMAALRAAKKGAAPAPKGGFTDEQLFFLGYAQEWCGAVRTENQRVRVKTDPHAPPRFRVNGPLSNLPEFGAAFQCKAGAKMVRPPAERCEVW